MLFDLLMLARNPGIIRNPVSFILQNLFLCSSWYAFVKKLLASVRSAVSRVSVPYGLQPVYPDNICYETLCQDAQIPFKNDYLNESTPSISMLKNQAVLGGKFTNEIANMPEYALNVSRAHMLYTTLSMFEKPDSHKLSVYIRHLCSFTSIQDLDVYIRKAYKILRGNFEFFIAQKTL